MTAPFRNVAIFAKPRTEGNRPALQQVLLHIVRLVEQAGLTPMIEAATREAVDLREFEGYGLATLAQKANVAIVLGGDGTMLGIARELSAYRIPLIGINFGRLGFITDIGLDDMPDVLTEMLAGRFETEHRTLLEGEVLRNGVSMHRGRAFNDVVVSHGTAGGILGFTVRVDGATMYNQRADGVILATPTGSTAYALSASGPILHPSLAGLVLVPVAPHTLSNRPITLPDSVVVEIELTEMRDASAHFDMQLFSPLQSGDVVRARLSADRVTLLHPAGYNYFETLRHKLHWNMLSGEPYGRA
ncbi:MAG TPA: NAD kinase [Burkholderiaceae bacterium]|nr:NAD kinase [Burkholderiaceae bacterium]